MKEGWERRTYEVLTGTAAGLALLLLIPLATIMGCARYIIEGEKI